MLEDSEISAAEGEELLENFMIGEALLLNANLYAEQEQQQWSKCLECHIWFYIKFTVENRCFPRFHWAAGPFLQRFSWRNSEEQPFILGGVCQAWNTTEMYLELSRTKFRNDKVTEKEDWVWEHMRFVLKFIPVPRVKVIKQGGLYTKWR